MINIGFGGRILTSDELRTMGWALIGAATAQDRYALQLAQSKANPCDEKQRAQADRAASAVLRAARRVRKIIEGFRA